MAFRFRTLSVDTGAIWAIALPAMVTNVATALIGLGDMWVVGRLGDPATQGAVDIGARLFAVLFTVMNFLKTGTTGLVAQEGTRAGAEAQAAMLMRGLTLAAIIGLALLAAKPVLQPLFLGWLGAQGAVLPAAQIYADIRYWSAPGVMLNLALIGYMVGKRQMTAVLIFEIAYNALNIVLGLWFVLSLDMGIAGIGWSSFIAEYAKLIAVLAFVLRGEVLAHLTRVLAKADFFRWHALRPFLSINRDLFLRTLVLMLALAALTRLSAERGAVMLAANGIIYQMFVITALLLDGFENAAQVLNGERYGAKDRTGFVALIRALMLRGMGAAALLSLLFLIASGPILSSFAANDEVAQAARDSAIWLVIFPIVGVAGFIFDGVFVGASWTRALLGTMLGAAGLYASMLWWSWPLGNHGLWLSFTAFLIARAVLQALWLPRLIRRSIPPAP